MSNELSPINLIKDQNISSVELFEEYTKSFRNMIEALLNNNKSLFNFPIPEIIYPVDHYIFNNTLFDDEKINNVGPSIDYYRSRHKQIIEFIESIENENVVKIFPDILFNNDNVKVIENRRALYFDNNHLDLYGASLIVNEILKNNEKL